MFDFSVDRKRNALAHVCDFRGTAVETSVMVAKSMQPQDIFYCDVVLCGVSDFLFLPCLPPEFLVACSPNFLLFNPFFE